MLTGNHGGGVYTVNKSCVGYVFYTLMRREVRCSPGVSRSSDDGERRSTGYRLQFSASGCDRRWHCVV